MAGDCLLDREHLPLDCEPDVMACELSMSTQGAIMVAIFLLVFGALGIGIRIGSR